MSANEREKGERESTFLAISKFFFSFCDMGLFAEKFSTSPKKNGAGIKYENKEKENNSTHNVLRYV